MCLLLRQNQCRGGGCPAGVVPRLRLPFWAQLTSPPQPLLSPIPNRGSPVEKTPKLDHSSSGHMLGAVLTPEPPPPSTRSNDSSSCQSSRLPGQPPAREDPGQFPACCEERDGCARADGCRACSRRPAVSPCLRLAICGLNCFTLQALLAGFGRGRGSHFTHAREKCAGHRTQAGDPAS